MSDLNAIVASHPAVTFGSYPVSLPDVQTIVTLEAPADGEEALKAALAVLVSAMPQGAVVEVSESASLASTGGA